MDGGEHMMIWAGRFICFVLTLERCWWITCVELRTGRSVEQDYEQKGS